MKKTLFFMILLGLCSSCKNYSDFEFSKHENHLLNLLGILVIDSDVNVHSFISETRLELCKGELTILKSSSSEFKYYLYSRAGIEINSDESKLNNRFFIDLIKCNGKEVEEGYFRMITPFGPWTYEITSNTSGVLTTKGADLCEKESQIKL